MSVTVRPARPADAAGIVAVIRAGFAPSFVETMVYGCDGAERFVADALALPVDASESRYTVAVDGPRVVGAVELREARPDVVLNYIAVDPGHRTGGLARDLLRTALDGLGSPAPEAMVLDVLVDNAPARGWYERLGFVAEAETGWWALAPVRAASHPDARVRSYPQAEAAQARFGFSQIEVVTPGGTWPVGRLGRDWFRVANPAALADPDLAAALARLDPSRRLLALLPHPAAPPGATLRATTVRMRVPLPTLCARLGSASPPATLP